MSTILIISLIVLIIYTIYLKTKPQITYSHESFHIKPKKLKNPLEWLEYCDENNPPEWLKYCDDIVIHKTDKITHHKKYNDIKSTYTFSLRRELHDDDVFSDYHY